MGGHYEGGDVSSEEGEGGSEGAPLVPPLYQGALGAHHHGVMPGSASHPVYFCPRQEVSPARGNLFYITYSSQPASRRLSPETQQTKPALAGVHRNSRPARLSLRLAGNHQTSPRAQKLAGEDKTQPGLL